MTCLPVIDPCEIVTNQDDTGVIGRGHFGAVRLCTTTEFGRIAVKCYQVAGVGGELERRKDSYKKEANTLMILTHKNIVKVLGISSWLDSFGILMEYLPGGNLDKFLSNKNISEIPCCIKLRIAKELSEAICFLHKKNSSGVYIHGDIKPENIVLSLDLTAKLADFGSIDMAACTGASTLTVHQPYTKQHTPVYTAPEFLKDPHQSREKTMDVYSFGMVLYEILSRKKIFANASLSPGAVLQVICDRGLKPDLRPIEDIRSNLNVKDVFDLIVRIMKQCWAQKPSDRPDIQKVCTSLFEEFRNISKTEIEEQVEQLLNISKIQPLAVDEESSSTIDQFYFPFEKPSLAVQTTNRFHSITSRYFDATSNISSQRSSTNSSHMSEQEGRIHDNLDFSSEVVFDDTSDMNSALSPEEPSTDETTSLLRSSNTDFKFLSFKRKWKLCCYVCICVLSVVVLLGIGLRFIIALIHPECPLLSLTAFVIKSCTEERDIHSVCSFECDQGKHLMGTPFITCEDSLKWSDVPPTCHDTCPACLTGPYCKESTSWEKLKKSMKDIGALDLWKALYAGYNVTCLPSPLMDDSWTCTCTDISSSIFDSCYEYDSPSEACEHALPSLIRDMVAKKIYPEPCDAKSMTTNCL